MRTHLRLTYDVEHKHTIPASNLEKRVGRGAALCFTEETDRACAPHLPKSRQSLSSQLSYLACLHNSLSPGQGPEYTKPKSPKFTQTPNQFHHPKATTSHQAHRAKTPTGTTCRHLKVQTPCAYMAHRVQRSLASAFLKPSCQMPIFFNLAPTTPTGAH